MRQSTLLPVVLFVLVQVITPCSHASLSIYMQPEDLARSAPLIVEGTVLEVSSGMDPVSGTVATYITIDVSTVHRGPEDTDRIVIRELGGTYGGVVHELDAVPVYTPGEQVFLFLSPGNDGALHTAGMFYGKFIINYNEQDASTAGRDLRRRGRIIGLPGAREEQFTLNDLQALVSSVRLRQHGKQRREPSRRDEGVRPDRTRRTGRSPDWLAEPSEFGRVDWSRSMRLNTSTRPLRSSASAGNGTIDRRGSSGPEYGIDFTTLSSSNPTRWYEVDSGLALSIDIERANNPLGDGDATVAEVERAFAAWTNVPESRLTLQPGNDNADFTGDNPTSSPAASYPPGNIILFGDPYGDIDDPIGCSGVLAIGGYWRSGATGPAVNGVVFNRALRMYVIFNNDFECFLGNSDNLAEVTTHELGHCIGLGHSTISDAIMRSSAYGGRGPRLGDDDMDALHCVYPHTLAIDSPDGGETLTAGDTHTIQWSSTYEAGSDDGQVDLEYSNNDGTDWITIASGTANDNSHPWTVPTGTGDRYLVRVIRSNRVGTPSAPFPTSCSMDESNTSFSVIAGEGLAGSVGPALAVDKSGSDIAVSWSASCSGDADQYAIYEGSLSNLRSNIRDHEPVTCTAGTDLSETFTPAAGDRYYLVSPLSGTAEGSLGTDGGGLERPASASSCGTQEADSTCP